MDKLITFSTVKKENVKSDLVKSIEELYSLASQHCWNSLNVNNELFLTELYVKESDSAKRVNNENTSQSLSFITDYIANNYSELLDINLFVNKSTKDKTAIEVRCVFHPKPASQEVMIHSKLEFPPYSNGGTVKFDVNWKNGGIRNSLRMFFGRLNAIYQLRIR